MPAWMSRTENDPFENISGLPPPSTSSGGDNFNGNNGIPPPSRDRDYHNRRQEPPQSSPPSSSQRHDPRHDRRYDRDYYDERRDRQHRNSTNNGGRSSNPSSSSSSRRRATANRSGIYFNSYEEEREWVDERRRRRHDRKSLFDVLPTAEQLALEELQKAALASSGPNPNVFLKPEEIKVKQQIGVMAGGGGHDGDSIWNFNDGSQNNNVDPQQTRHARRLYVGNLPDDLTENDIHSFFRSAVYTALGEDKNDERYEDPILSVYINKERKFSFVEFKSVDICTACMSLDGIDIDGKGTVKVKRPNDYNPALAMPTNSDIINRFDVSKLGLISTNVPDSPNKIFIGGLPYHLTENEVLELLRAFGEVKAFHLVKSDPLSTTSKGYCFVEYVDSNVKDIAVMGLNGMDMGNGKQLSAKLATVNTTSTATPIGSMIPQQSSVSSIGMVSITESIAPPIMKVVDGVDIEALLDVAMGKASNNYTTNPSSSMNYAQNNNPSSSVLDIANAALAAAYGHQGY